MSRAAEAARSASIWLREGTSEDGWTALELAGRAFALRLAREPKDRLEVAALEDLDAGLGGPSAVLALVEGALGDEWCLLSGADEPWINGDRVVVGVRVLQNHDEIRFAGGARFYFSTERVARPERFPGADRSVLCPRCSCEIAAGEAVVQCPQPSCRMLHHHSDAAPDSCWLSAPACAGSGCTQKTSFDVDTRWTPED